MQFDTSFIREGKTLAQWLPELVCDDYDRRKNAGEALGGMWQAIPSYSTKWDGINRSTPMPDLGSQQDRFLAAIRAAVEEPEFPKAIFVRRLMLFRMSLHQGWLEALEKMSSHDETYDARQTQLIELALTSKDASERTLAVKRFQKLFCAGLAHDSRIRRSAETMQPQGMVSYLAMNALDTALLEAADTLREVLDFKGTRHEALEALQRIGRPAGSFAPALLQGLEQDRYYDGAAALASVGADDPATVNRLLELLSTQPPPQRFSVLAVLTRMGPRLAGREKECLERLLVMASDKKDGWQVLRALGSIGRGDERGLNIILNWAQPRPPRMRPMEGFPDAEIDEAMHARGMAISALEFFTDRGERVIPTLVDAIDTFEEFDSDWSYHGSQGRVLDVLSKFGEAARKAVAKLSTHLRDKDGEIDWGVVRFLGRLGPDAAEALPALRELAEESGEEPPSDRTAKTPDEETDTLAWAIYRVSGGRGS